ncbi:MAG: ABC transporter ATP-binding protein [Candidatus Thermoplasmatota archaeon]
MMVRLEDIHFSYEESATETIKGINLTIEEGKNYAFIGRNGSGKTTLLKLISGLLEPDSGRIIFQEKEPEVGFSPEDPELGFFEKTVKEEVGFYPKNLGLDHKKIARETLKKVGITHLKKRSPYLLSSGEQRLVSIASVLSGLPEILVLDEPTHSLHRKGEKMVRNVLKELEKTILFSTHSSDFALEVADEVIVLQKGEILDVGKAREVLSDVEKLEEAGIRAPGLVRWARDNSREVPSSLDEAVGLVKEGKE